MTPQQASSETGFRNGIVAAGMFIPYTELSFSFSRSSGPGGQHVNKVNTKVILNFDVNGSAVLSDEQKELLRKRLASRINRSGLLRISSGTFRSQRENRKETERIFAKLLEQALRTDTPRRRTCVPWRIRQQRLRAKKHRGALKKTRTRVAPDRE